MSLRIRSGLGRPAAAGLPAAMLALLLLGACAGDPFGRGQPVAAPAAPPPDPIADFAARAVPGASGTVPQANGQPAAVRLARSYHAASGRECREVLVGAGMSQRSQLVCKTEAGAWTMARPLLRGGSTSR